MSNNVFDVAQYVLSKMGNITAMKLQKICYYSQAWSLVWDGEPMFEENIQAWANGPVIPDLYNCHRGEYIISQINRGNAGLLDDNKKDTIDRVISFYGQYNSQQLSDLTHMESPWKNARRGIPVGERSEVIISLADIAEYYSSLNA